METPDVALAGYLKPETYELLQTLARTSRPAANYLKGLEACAFLLSLAHAFDQLSDRPEPGDIDRLFEEMAQTINATLGDLSRMETLIDELTGYTSESYLQRKQRITARGKTALLARMVRASSNRAS